VQKAAKILVAAAVPCKANSSTAKLSILFCPRTFASPRGRCAFESTSGADDKGPMFLATNWRCQSFLRSTALDSGCFLTSQTLLMRWQPKAARDGSQVQYMHLHVGG
jgi:hypothetical protein